MQAAQRNSRRTHACYVCGGVKEIPAGRGQRCSGYISEDGKYQYCSREETAGGISPNAQGLYVHILDRTCKCGQTHTTSAPPPPSLPPTLHVLDAPEQPLVETAVYRYVDLNGEVMYEKVRYGNGAGKTFKMRHLNDGQLCWGMPPDVEPILYNLAKLPDALSRDEPILVVEGEKDADTLTAYGYTAVTNYEGASAGDTEPYGHWRDSYSEQLTYTPVVLIPDNDATGRNHMSHVALSLAQAGAPVIRTLFLDGLPPKGDVTDWFTSGHTAEEFEDVLAALLDAPEEASVPPSLPEDSEESPLPKKTGRFTPLSMSQLSQLRPTRFLIDGVIEEQSVTMLYGDPGAGKSFIAIDWALSVAYERNWFGRSVRKGRVLYVASENPHGYKPRIAAWKRKYRLTEDSENFFLLPVAVNVTQEHEVHELLDYAPGPWSLMVFDTFANSTGGADENSSGEMKVATQHLRQISQHTGAAVVFVHHPAKGGGPRGSTVMMGDVDTQISVVNPANVEIRCEKMRNGRKFPDIELELHEVELANADPEDGYIPTSCYLTFPSIATNSFTLDSTERAILKALCSTQGYGMTRADLRMATGLEDRVLFANLEKLALSGRVDHLGWKEQTTRRYWPTDTGAALVGMRPPSPQHTSPAVATPSGSCALCGNEEWEERGGAWVCSQCGLEYGS